MSKGLNQHTVRQSEGKARARKKKEKMQGLADYAVENDRFTLSRSAAGSFHFPCDRCADRFQMDTSENCNGTKDRAPCGHLKGSF